jgi:hypothetical protein
MIIVNEDNSIYLTRGDTVAFNVAAIYNDQPFEFKSGDTVRLRVTEKKNTTNVVLERDFPVSENTEEVQILLTSEDTKIGDDINKPVDYWYEIEYQDTYGNVQTIVGYDEDGAKIFRLYPEGGE